MILETMFLIYKTSWKNVDVIIQSDNVCAENDFGFYGIFKYLRFPIIPIIPELQAETGNKKISFEYPQTTG